MAPDGFYKVLKVFNVVPKGLSFFVCGFGVNSDQMSAVYLKSIRKIELIKRFSSSQTLRNKFTTIDIGLMETYVQFCNRIKEIYNF